MTDERISRALESALGLGEVGIQIAAYLDGHQIVDAWAGEADPSSGRRVDGETLFAVFSVTKAVAATALHIQAERGLVDYRAPVGRYWPEYASHGKEETTVAHVLSHRSGVPQMPPEATPERLTDWDWMIAQIEAFEPRFAPGTTNAYHEIVWGWIVGEIVRRTDPAQRDFARFVREEITEPLGIDDLFLGVPDGALKRVAPVITPWDPAPTDNPYFNESMPLGVFPSAAVHNLDVVRQACHPGAGVIANARSMARFFAMLACGGQLDGVRLLSRERLMSITEPRKDAESVDRVMGWVVWVGTGGLWLGGPCPPAYPVLGHTGSGPHTLCHPGIGGSIGWADLDSRLSVSICHNWQQPDEVQGSTDPGVNPFIAIGDAVRAVAADMLRTPA